MKILITGGAGFIGSHLSEKLVLLGHHVVVLDNLSNGNQTFLSHIQKDKLTFVKGSVTERSLLQKWIDECDLIFHLAATLGVKTTVEDPLKIIHGNIDGTRNVLEIAYESKKKVIFSSTSEVYGKNPNLPFAESSDRVLGPSQTNRWCYATAKSLDEHMCFAYAQKGLPITVVRYFNAYGARQTSSQYGGVVPKFIVAALQNKPLTVYGDGKQTRCFTHVSDMVSATIACMDPKVNNEVFNIGTTEQVTINYLAKTIKELTQSNSPIVHIPYEKVYGSGYEDTPGRVPDLTKSNQLINFQPRVNLSEGLTNTIKWYEKKLNEEGGSPFG